MRKHAGTIYTVGVRSIPILWIIAMAIVLYGGIKSQHRIILIGTAIAFFALAVWGIFNGGAFVWGLVYTIRKQGRKEFVSDAVHHPFGAAMYGILMTFLLAVGACFLWLACHAILAMK